MTNRTGTGLFFAMLATGLYGCGGTPPGAPWPITETPTEPFVSTTAPVTRSLAGRVADAAGGPLPGARVEVLDGPHTVLSTITDSKGEFRLSGIEESDGTIHVRAATDQHVAATQAFQATRGSWWLNFSLEAIAPPANIAGDYSLTFIANPSCANLPDEARTRTYGATVTASAGPSATVARFDVRVHTPAILPSFDNFPIHVAGNAMTFEIGDPGHSGAGLVEQVAPNRYVALDGLVTAVVTDPSTISAPLNGAVYVCELSGVWSSPYGCGGTGGTARGGCHSTNHQLILRRR